MLCLFRIRAHEKIWKIMRLCCIFVMFFVFSVSARSLGQEQVVTLKLTKVSLYELFDAIHKQTGLRFLYNAEQMNTVSSVDVSVKNKKVCDVLTDVLAGTSLTTVFDKDLVMLVKRTEALQQKTKEIKIVGKVTDTQKQPIPGVTVVVKGTTLGAVTDQDGMYALRLPQMKEDFLLIYSFIGMESQEIKYQGKDTINVVLREDVKQVDEVVVTGIFTRKKESFTGSSTTFTTKELKMVGNSNILQSLKTLDPAFAIMENNEFGSDPNHLPNIEIRGKTSVIGLTEEYNTDPNQPLFILDGFESTLATISDLSVDRVASITILKDAAATAIYGAKAANGVVVVETKAPEAGQLRLNYTGNLNFTFADLSDYNLMNAEEKLEYELLCGAI